jgi:hypothetical protein
LTKLSAQIAEEGKVEAAQYDKYACFCKEQADQKTYQIEKSKGKIEKLTAEIELLDSEITELSASIGSLGEEITSLGDEIGNETQAREEEHEKYVVADENITAGIQAVRDAIAALQASKAQMSETKLYSLPQVQTAVALAAAVPQVTPAAAKHLAFLQAATGQGQPKYVYTYQSNEIIATLEGLLLDFKESKKEADEAEFESKSMSEKKVLGLTNDKTFKEKEKAQKEAIVGEKTSNMHEKTGDKDAEQEAMNADISFQEDLTATCEAAATQFDQRSTTRASELTSITEAIEILKTGVNPMYAANKQLVGLAAKHAVVQKHGKQAAVQTAQTKGTPRSPSCRRFGVNAEWQARIAQRQPSAAP